MKNLSWNALNSLSESYGDSFYLLNLVKFESNYQEFLTAFKTVYAHSQLAYSYKTNYTPRLCASVQRMGGYAEVVSGMEYALAVRIGVPPERIIFNGPYKQRADFEQALLQGSVVNLDSEYEVTWLKSLASQFPGCAFRVGIRCNFSIGTPQRSRFGFDVENDEFKAIVQELRGIACCRIAGLHCHYLAAERSAGAYGRIAEQMVALALTEFADAPLAFIDLGGGFFSRMNHHLQQQFPYPIPTFSDYGRAIAGVFAAAFPANDGPELILEPGIALTADVMQFIAKTIDVKQVGERKLALVAGSRYDVKPTLSPRNLPMTVVSSSQRSPQLSLVDIVGSTCMEDDYLYKDYVGDLTAGDYVVFDNVGAYTNVLRPPFINPASPILSVSSAGEISVVRRRETLDDIFASYHF